MGNIGKTLTTMPSGNPGSRRQDTLHEIGTVPTFDLDGNQTNGGPITTEKYLYDGWNCIAEYTGTNLKKTNLWGLDQSGTLQGAGGVGGLLLITDHSTLITSHYPCYDGNGNIRKLLQATTLATTATYDYGPFGELIRATGPYAAANSYRFSTKPQDKDTGLLYYNYRPYDTKTGRWLSRDPIEEKGGVNLYGFVGNGGINSWDTLGLDPPGKGVNSGECCGGKNLDTALNSCINGVQVSTSEKVKVKICRRIANIAVVGLPLGAAGLKHEFVCGPDGPPVGMGPVGTIGNPGPSYPGVPTELTDHTGEDQGDCQEYEVSRCLFFQLTKVGTPAGRFFPPRNDCNTCASGIIERSGGPPTQLLNKLNPCNVPIVLFPISY